MAEELLTSQGPLQEAEALGNVLSRVEDSSSGPHLLHQAPASLAHGCPAWLAAGEEDMAVASSLSHSLWRAWVSVVLGPSVQEERVPEMYTMLLWDSGRG